MRTTVDALPRFKSRLKRLERKYSTAVDQVQTLIEQLERGERPGERTTGSGAPSDRAMRGWAVRQAGESIARTEKDCAKDEDDEEAHFCLTGLPNALDWVVAKRSVASNDCQVMANGLRDNHAVEWISMP